MAEIIIKNVKKSKKKLIKWWTLFIGLIFNFFTILIYGNCDWNRITCEYGCPTATFKISGTIRDASTDSAIPGIQVSLRSPASNNAFCYIIADKNGEYKISEDRSPQMNELIIYAEDIDGTTDGLYNSKEISIKVNSSDFKGGKGWDEGTASYTLDIKLQKKKQ